ncbi:MAG TPA: hypothetical protein VKV26_23470 [Dehalococcoidia bacterium]|nr:hypothetical protein [Dehalococcoidia bacterium]
MSDAAPALDDLYIGEGEPFDAVNERLYRAGLTDGLPVVPPTPGRVRRMYGEARLDPTAYVGELEPGLVPIRIYQIAVCAVMAGCEPAHLPFLVAGVLALGEPAFNLLGIQTTTGSAAPVLIVSGPGALAAGISGGANCLGGGVRANAAIGRALRLVLQNLGGARAGGMDMATMGQPAKLGLCFAENENRSPWPPLHVERGFGAGETVITAAGISGTIEVVHGSNSVPEEILLTLAHSMTIAGNMGSAGYLGGGEPLVVLSYEHAQALAAAGLDKAAVKRFLWRHARLPLGLLGNETAAQIRAHRAPEHDVDALLVARTPEEIMLVVAGGVGIKSTYMPTWGGGTRAQSARVRV